MFVEISEPKDVIEVDIWYKEKRKANGGKISPEIAMEALSYTNNFANIKFMLKDIENLENVEEKVKFKDVIFSMIEGRLSSADTIEKMRSIASECGFLDEFDRHRVYCNMQLKKGGFTSLGRVYHNTFPQFCKISTFEELQEKAEFWGNNIDKTPDVLICDVKDDIEITEGRLPDFCIFSKSKNLTFTQVKGMGKVVKLEDDCVCKFLTMSIGKNVEFNKCKELVLFNCSLQNVKNFDLRKDCELNLYNSRDLPKNMDLSMCRCVNFDNVSFASVEKVRLKDERDKGKLIGMACYFTGCEIVTLEEEARMLKLKKEMQL